MKKSSRHPATIRNHWALSGLSRYICLKERKCLGKATDTLSFSASLSAFFCFPDGTAKISFCKPLKQTFGSIWYRVNEYFSRIQPIVVNHLDILYLYIDIEKNDLLQMGVFR